MVTPAQIRAARALLRLDQQDLARRAGVSVATVRRLEGEAGATSVAPHTIKDIQGVLEAAGIEFITDGVRHCQARSERDREALFRDILKIADRAAARLKGSPNFTEKDLYDDTGLPV